MNGSKVGWIRETAHQNVSNFCFYVELNAAFLLCSMQISKSDTGVLLNSEVNENLSYKRVTAKHRILNAYTQRSNIRQAAASL